MNVVAIETEVLDEVPKPSFCWNFLRRKAWGELLCQGGNFLFPGRGAETPAGGELSIKYSRSLIDWLNNSQSIVVPAPLEIPDTDIT